MDYFPSTGTESTDGIPLTQLRTLQRGVTRLAHPDLITFLAAAQRYNVELVPVVWEAGRGLLGKGGTADINQLMLHEHYNYDDSADPDPQKNTPSKETSFAFKRTSQYLMESGATEGLSLYEILTMELIVMKQQAISDHANIVNLEGICWEVTHTNHIYPVLLFEKASWGDLGSFACGLRGGNCTFNAKLGFGIDIAKALQVMHGLNRVHGDIKPQNVLLFDDEPKMERYTTSGSAKLTDFGYSCFGAQDSDIVSLPYSGIWSPPEYHDRGLELRAAKKADMFSFGLTFVYLLFYWEVWDNLLNLTDLKMRNYIKDGTILRRVKEAIGKYYDSELQRTHLSEFFTLTLAYEAEARETNLETLIQLLKQARVISSAPVLSKGPFVIQPSEDLVKKIVATQGALYQKLPIPQPATGLQGSRATKTDRDSSPSVLRAGLGRVQQLLGTVFQNDAKPRRLRSESLVKGLHRGHTSQIDKLGVTESQQASLTHLSWDDTSHNNFNMSYMILALSLTDYRVRQGICSTMEARISGNSTILRGRCDPCIRNTALQLALCYKLGFGVPADQEKAAEYLTASGSNESDLHREVLKVKQLTGFGFIDFQSRPAKLVDEGIIVVWDFVDDYRRTGLRLNEVRDYHTREYVDMKRVLGGDSDVMRLLKAILAKLYALEGDAKTVERLRRELVRTSSMRYGDASSETLHAKENLGIALLDTGSFAEAESLLRSAFDGMSNILGHRHLSTLAAQSAWCDCLYHQGRYAEVLPIYDKLYSELSELLGVPHPDSVTAMEKWASALGATGDFTFSKTLHSLVWHEREIIFGPRHEVTLASRTTLAVALRRIGKYAEAEQMHRFAVDGFDDLAGASRANALTALNEFALTLELQGRTQEAEVLRQKARRQVSEIQADSNAVIANT